VSPEPLAPATSEAPDARLSCDGRTFPASGTRAPLGAEKAVGPEYDALRATLTMFADEFPGSSTWSWRLAGRDDTGAIFLARIDAPESPGWISAEAKGRR